MLVILVPLLLCALFYVLDVSYIWCVATLSTLAWVSMFPPRVLLRWLQHKTGVRFMYEEGEEKSGKKVIYLTIDDVPSRHGTEHILQALQDCGVKATMFVIGDQANAMPEILKQLALDGHQFGNHDWTNRLSCAVLEDRLINDLQATHNLLIPFGSVNLFRPGSALFTPTLLNVANRMCYTTVLGDVYAHDGFLGFISTTLVAWHAKWRVCPGSIIVLHDGLESVARHTATVIRDIVPYFHERGYTFALLK